MYISRRRPPVGVILYFSGVFALGLYFAFAAIQGDYGLFRRVQIDAEANILRQDLEALSADVAWMENKTHRLSDGYLDLDLLDEQARSVLGLLRADEIVIR
ncbi:septum formation initiator precursor [Marinosulfonomonas sp. PRT-SC04]|nr:septum formation initiator precursor [Marinosulfonomonas sp. PRT-SC04]